MAAAFDYGKALVYLDTKQYDEAESRLKKAKPYPDNNFYLDAMSDLWLITERATAHQSMLAQALQRKPNNPVLVINYANVLIKDEKFSEAIRILQRYTHERPNDVNGWHLLAEANSGSGNSAEDLAARAEIFALGANWNKAIQFYTKPVNLLLR
ncbi:tetratricopeptide repeat protein [Vibrio metschnikovii]